MHPAKARLVAAAAVLALVWVALPGGVPLYDGIGFPDEPYRYVVPPAGYQHTPRPLSGKGSSTVEGGINANTIYVNTDEVAPQVNVVVASQLLSATAAVRTITITATPEAPDRQPSKGAIDGNVYHVAISTSPSGTAAWAPPPGDAASLATVTMRATSAQSPPPVFLYRSAPNLPWRVEATSRFGNDIYRCLFVGFGDYALAFGVVASHGSSSTTAILVSALLVVVLLAIGAVIAVRLTRRPARVRP